MRNPGMLMEDERRYLGNQHRIPLWRNRPAKTSDEELAKFALSFYRASFRAPFHINTEVAIDELQRVCHNDNIDAIVRKVFPI